MKALLITSLVCALFIGCKDNNETQHHHSSFNLQDAYDGWTNIYKSSISFDQWQALYMRNLLPKQQNIKIDTN